MLTRGFLIIAVSVVAIASYVWFHMTYIMGVPVMLDMPFVLFHISLPIFILALLVGAAVLWTKTRHVAALIQLIACSVTFILAIVDEIARYLGPDGPLYKLTRRSPVQAVVQSVILVCCIAFPVAYIWYARAQKRI
ncbi:MAG TPA: hypothetical protein VEX43_05130 [Chthoniobacterales bacterium]|nr:hypothetical protein [Chthoniobacterales bacterium]